MKPTKREKEIISYIADGLSSKQIAAKICRALNTVKNHRKNILKKFGVKNSSELMRVMYLRKLLE